MPDLVDRLDDRIVLAIGSDLAHEGAIDLQPVDRQLLEIGIGREATAEIVQRHVTAHRLEVPHDASAAVEI